MSLGHYLLGVAILTAIAAPLVYAAVISRRLLLPAWSGAPARLAEAIVALALILWTSELAGSIGLFHEVPLILLSLVVGGTAWAIGGKNKEGRTPTSPADTQRARESGERPTGTWVAALAATALVTAAWAIPLAASYAGGIDGVDSTWYHLPQSAVFAQSGSVIDLHFTDPYFLNWYYPAHSELLHAVPMLAFDRDWLSPLLNHGFLALGLLAGWCIGRPWGLGPATLVAVAIVFGSEMMLDFQPGEARNDAVGLAFFLAAVAFLLQPKLGTGSDPLPNGRVPLLALAGLAAGLAVGTKLTMLAPVAALTLAVAVLAGRARWWRDGGIFLSAVVAGGGFWYARNLMHSGNPLPWIDSLGPISLPAPDVALELRPPHSVARYLFELDVWEDWFLPGLGDSIGPLWPVVLLLAAGAAVIALATRSDRRLAVLGGVVLVTFAAYLVTPLTASGPEGMPEGFVWNLRYIAPALALGLVLVPLLPPLRGRRASLAVVLVLLAALTFQTASLGVWELGQEAWAVGSAIVVLVIFGAGWWLARRQALPRALIVGGGAVLAAAVVAAGYVEQDRYLERRYADVLDGLHLDRAISWANEVSGARIATAGRGGVFFQYGFYGTDLSNEVQWVGEPGARGAWLPLETCESWRGAVANGEYDYVVTTYDRRFPEDDETSREREWLRRDEAAEAISRDGPVTVYELDGAPDPDGCGSRELAAEDRPTGVAERAD